MPRESRRHFQLSCSRLYRYIANVSSTALTFLLFIVPLVGLVLGCIAGYNRLIRFRNRVTEAWSGIDVQLKRRHDLVPNLVSAVKAYQTHERAILEAVTQQRSAAMAARTVAATEQAEKSLSSGLHSVLAVAESYPDLKSDANFRKLMTELVEVEDSLQYARRYYNGAVRDLNNSLESFPSNLIGKIASFSKADFFEVSKAVERDVVEVRL